MDALGDNQDKYGDTSLRYFYSAQNNSHDKKENFITNFTYKVYNKYPDGQTLVYSYRLLYWPSCSG